LAEQFATTVDDTDKSPRFRNLLDLPTVFVGPVIF